MIPELVAHRGWASRYPENTLPALRAALEAGADWVEVDVQLSRDRVPVLFHDESLRRTTGAEGSPSDRTFSELRRLDAGFAARFGARFAGTPIPALADLAAAIEPWPRATIFVEIKRAALRRFGTGATVERVLEALGAARGRCVIISFDEPAASLCRSAGVAGIGVVLDGYHDEARRRMERLAPEFLFCDVEKLPAGTPLWPGPWRWAIYEVTAADAARALADRGAALVESMAFGELREHLAAPAGSRDG